MRMGMVRMQPLIPRWPEKDADMRALVDDALDDLVCASNVQSDRNQRMRLHEMAKAFLHQPVDIAFAGHDVDVAGLNLANAVDLRKQVLLLALLPPQIEGQ